MEQNKKARKVLTPFMENWAPIIVLILVCSLILMLCGAFEKLISVYSILLYSWSLIELIFYKSLFKRKKIRVVLTVIMFAVSSVFLMSWISWQFVLIYTLGVVISLFRAKIFPNIFHFRLWNSSPRLTTSTPQPNIPLQFKLTVLLPHD